ncbi:conserved hypothetical protein [Tenacibaculum sp. 190524A02b]|uniref:Uncharacterized protein n=1 Tax=Tenacibaculum vairaonense TaxID=3137860 RepID=A0ABP1FCS5_9FLAO
MKFFKIITYVFLIGFIIDLIGDFFNLEKLSDDFKTLPPKGRVALIFGSIVTTILTQLNSIGFEWVLLCLFVTASAMIYYSFTSANKDKEEEVI